MSKFLRAVAVSDFRLPGAVGWILLLNMLVIPIFADSTFNQWVVPVDKAIVPGTPEFDMAIELRNGDFVISGGSVLEGNRGRSVNFLLRVSPSGAVIWLKLLNKQAENLHETANGIVTMNTGDPHAVLYDANGDTLNLLRNVTNTNYKLLSDDDILNVERLPLNSEGDFKLIASKQSFKAGLLWTTEIISSPNYNTIEFLDLGKGNTLFFLSNRFWSDTLRLRMLSSRGNIGWSKTIATPVIEWKIRSQLPNGSFILYGKTPPTRGDSLVLMGLDSTGDFSWMKSYSPSRISQYPSIWDNVAIHPSDDAGFELRYRRRWGEKAFYFNSKGELEKEINMSNWAGYWAEGMLYNNIHDTTPFMGMGYSEDFISSPIMGTIATAKVHPAIFIPVEGDVAWKTIRLEGFGDTVYTTGTEYMDRMQRKQVSFVRGRGLYIKFALPTSDGGLLVGGGIWRRNGSDTTSYAAVKLGSGYSVGLGPSRKARWNRPRGGHVGSQVNLLGQVRSTPRYPGKLFNCSRNLK